MSGSRAVQVGVAVAGIVVIATGTLLPFNSSMAPNPLVTPASQALDAVVKLVWLTAVLVARARQPSSPVWKLMLGYVLVSEVWAFGYFPNAVIYSVASTFARLDLAVLAHVLVAFPSGHLKTRFDRAVVGSTYALILAPSLISAVIWEQVWDSSSACGICPPNVFLVWPNNELNVVIWQATRIVSPIFGALVLYAVWRHWRAAGPVARRALLPVVLAMPLTVLTPIAYVGEVLGNEILLLGRLPIYEVGITLLPVALLLGVLRLRLDRGRVAGLLVELGRGVPAGGLREALSRALGDPTLQLAFAGPDPGGYIDTAGHAVELPTGNDERAAARIERDGEALAVIIHDRAIDEEDPGLVEAVGTAARFAIDTERLTAQVRAQLEEVRASRARIVEAADAERRKVERDLHDGAQQRLVALAMRLQLARVTSRDAGALIDEATAELEAAIAEVRDLARGVHPPILAEAGLAAALETLAERSPVPVRITATDARFQATVEVTAYYVVAEALTNTARYAAATEAVVSVAGDGGRLVVSVSDDGRGGADPQRGSGLRGLADRVAAVGGRLTVTSPPGGGTTVTAELPVG